MVTGWQVKREATFKLESGISRLLVNGPLTNERERNVEAANKGPGT